MRQIILTATLAMVVATPASATTFYEQVDNGQICRNSCWTSQSGPYSTRDSKLTTQRIFDDFRLTDDRSITTVQWRGYYQADPMHVDGNLPNTANTVTWDIGFFADDNGRPGEALHVTTLAAGDVRTDLIRPATVYDRPVDFLNFTAQLPTAFEASAGTRYWISPISNAVSWQSRFIWASSFRPGNGGFIKAFPFPVHNRSFSIGNDGIAAAVPEPASWAMMILGFGLVGLTARRRPDPLRIGA